MRLVQATSNTRITLNDLRPVAIDEIVRDACEKDVAFLQKNTDKFELRFCPACLSQDFSPFCEKSSFTFVQCVACLSILMNPAPNLELLVSFYNQSENYKVWGSFVYPLTHESRWNSLHKKRSEKIRDAITEFLPRLGQLPTPLNYLELGAGTGDTAERFRLDSSDMNVQIGVVEVNPTMLQILADRSIEAHALEDIEDGSQDVIAAFEVLEHILDPTEVLRQVNSKLSPGGIFVFSTPNSLSLEVQVLREHSTTLDQEHITVLSLVGLAISATRTGMIVRRLEAAGELDLELISKANGLGSEGLVFSERLRWGSQKDIANSNLSSSSTGVFQKAI